MDKEKDREFMRLMEQEIRDQIDRMKEKEENLRVRKRNKDESREENYGDDLKNKETRAGDLGRQMEERGR